MTHGISPKIIPAILVALAGLIVTVIAAVNQDSATLTAGISLLGGGGFAAVGGYASPPGEVVVDVGPASDDLLALPDDDPELSTK